MHEHILAYGDACGSICESLAGKIGRALGDRHRLVGPDPEHLLRLKTGSGGFTGNRGPNARGRSRKDGMNVDEDKEGRMKVKLPNQSTMPTRDAIIAHERAHQPYCSWCGHCVMGEADDVAHAKTSDETAHPRVVMNYMFRGEGVESKPILVTFGDGKQYLVAMAVCGKGSSGMTPERVTDWMVNLGHNQLTINSAQEPAVTDLQSEARKKYAEELGKLIKEVNGIRVAVKTQVEISLEISSVGESQPNWLSLGINIGRKLKSDDAIWPRFIENAADFFNRFKVGEGGLTPFKRMKGRESNQPIAAFGGKMLYHVPKQISKTRGNATARWEEAILLGFHVKSNEYMSGSKRGVIKVHSIKITAPELCWDSGFISDIQGVPGRPVLGRMSLKIASYIGGGTHAGLDSDSDVETTDPITDEVQAEKSERRKSVTRRFHITKQDRQIWPT